jgi:predicted SAM-dependent methyltransferase
MLQCAGYDAEGVELNVESAEWGTRHYGIPIQIGTLETLLSDGRQHAYDLVTLTDVLEHTVNPLEGLKFVSGLLKPGGHILVTFPDIRSLKSQIYRLLAKLTGRGWVTCHIPFHTWEFTQTTAVDCFNRAGFSVVAFRRSEPKEDFVERYLRLFLFPMRILSLDILARTLGTQMEFVLRKIEGRNRCT